MLDKARLGIEDKAMKPGETKGQPLVGPGSVSCPSCKLTSHYMARSIPANCTNCGAEWKLMKG